MRARARGALLVGATFMLAAPRARTEPLASFSADQRLQVVLNARAGTSTGPYVTSAFPETTAYGVGLTVRTRLRVSPRLSWGLRVPLVLARVEQPAGALFAEADWGNPELSFAFELWRLERDGWTLDVATGLALGAPLAEHDDAQLAGRALAFANALEGYGEPELFTAGVVPITPSGQLLITSRRWSFGASLKLPVLARISTASLPPESNTRALGFVPVAELSARLQVRRWLAFSAAPRLAVRAVSAVDDHASSTQLSAGGQVEFRLGNATNAAIGIQAPLGGALGGSTFAGGVSVLTAF
jgi:hypothetical protein